MNHSLQYSINDINTMDHRTFVKVFSSVFEDTPWIAERTWDQSPFNSVESLINLMCQVVIDADYERQMTLLRAHPELGASEKMTALSEAEQAGAGIRAKTDDGRASLAKLNKEYREKFGFPFIVAIKGMNLSQIIENLTGRLHNDKDTEFREGLDQVLKIAQFRVHDLFITE